MTATTPIDALRTNVRGPVIEPGQPGYDDARAVWNGMIDRRPKVIVRASGTADVAAAVNYARDNKLPLSIKGGGHGAAGTAVCDDGIMIDLSLMRGVRVDPAAQTAHAQGGATWGDYDRETQLFGLASTGGVISTTGIGGLTLGGGLGSLVSKYGLAIDNLISADVVLADGSVVTASEKDNADLFWALRGGGGNFGVVTSFEYRLHKIGPMVTGGLLAFPIERAREVLRVYRDVIANAPDELTCFAAITGAPPDGAHTMVAIIPMHCGSLEDGAKAIQPFKDLGPMLDLSGPIPYTAHQSMLDAGFGPGNQIWWKGSFLRELSDEALEILVSFGEQLPSPASGIVIEDLHGAFNRVAPDATAFAHRQNKINLALVANWQTPDQADACKTWNRALYAAVQPFAGEGVYSNYLGVDEADGRVRTAYGPNYERLAQVKAKYDPQNLFRNNWNIVPA